MGFCVQLAKCIRRLFGKVSKYTYEPVCARKGYWASLDWQMWSAVQGKTCSCQPSAGLIPFLVVCLSHATHCKIRVWKFRIPPETNSENSMWLLLHCTHWTYSISSVLLIIICICFVFTVCARARCQNCDCDLSVYGSKTMNWNFWQPTIATAAVEV